MPEEHESVFHRQGIDTISEVFAFLGGIFFTALLILVQQGEKFQSVIFETRVNENLSIAIRQIHFIAIPLMTSIVFFVFSTLFFSVACTQTTQRSMDEVAELAFKPFVVAFISLFISLFVILLLVDIFVGILGTILSVSLAIWWQWAVNRSRR